MTRIQLRRTKGWRLPAGAVKVDRTTVFGNPFVPGRDGTRAECVARFREWLVGPEPEYGCGRMAGGCWLTLWNPKRAAILFRLHDLRGKVLACWCPADAEHCHADVLTELAIATEGK